MTNTSREKIIEAALDIINKTPQKGRRVINNELRAKFGVGLRSSYISELQKQVYKQKKEEISLSGTKTVRVPKRFDKGQSERLTELINSGFTQPEAKELARAIKGEVPPYLKDLIAERKKLMISINEQGILSRTERLKKVKEYYRNKFVNLPKEHKDKQRILNMIDKSGTKDLNKTIFALLRWFKDFLSGKYPDYQSPTPKKQVKRKDFSAHRTVKQMEIEGKTDQKYPKGKAYK